MHRDEGHHPCAFLAKYEEGDYCLTTIASSFGLAAMPIG
jgi:hypothetical protein